MTELLVRLGWALAIILAGFAAYWIFNRALLHRLRNPLRGLEGMRRGVPAILYFTTPDCLPCKTQQRPALQRLLDELGASVQVIQVDATLRPELADYWGVLSVPTTFIIDSRGKPRGVNHGAASADKLRCQLEDAEGRPLHQKPGSHSLRSPIADRKEV